MVFNSGFKGLKIAFDFAQKKHEKKPIFMKVRFTDETTVFIHTFLLVYFFSVFLYVSLQLRVSTHKPSAQEIGLPSSF